MCHVTLVCYGINLTERNVIGVAALKNVPDVMISNTPLHLASLSTNEIRLDCVNDDVSPVTDAVNATEVVIPAEITRPPTSSDAELNEDDSD